MLEAKITIEAPELTAAINNLALAIRDSRPKMPQVPDNVVPMAQPQQAPTVQQAVPQQTPVMQAPVTPTNPVPTAPAPQYTKEQIMAAGATLMDAGRINDLYALLHSFGVQAVMDLKPDQLGPFATALRELGAKI